MNKKYYLIVGMLLLMTQFSFAHPPRSIDLQYDQDKGVLYVDIQHLSRDHLSHYIWKVEVTKNSEEAIVKTLHQQIDPNLVSLEVSLEAEEGDLIKIKAYSREGGIKEAHLELTKEILEAEVVREERAPARAISTIPKDKSKIKPAIPQDPEISKPTTPEDPQKIKPAVAQDPSVAKPAVLTDPDKVKPAVSRDPSVALPTIPQDSSKIIPALPSTNQ